MSGFSTAPALCPSRVSRSRPTTKAYSCARCKAFRVWKPTTRLQPFFANSARVSLVGDRESDRDGPGVLLALTKDDLFVEHAVPLLAGHRPGQRAKRPVAEAVEARQVGVGKRDRLRIGPAQFANSSINRFTDS